MRLRLMITALDAQVAASVALRFAVGLGRGRRNIAGTRQSLACDVDR